MVCGHQEAKAKVGRSPQAARSVTAMDDGYRIKSLRSKFKGGEGDRKRKRKVEKVVIGNLNVG